MLSNHYLKTFKIDDPQTMPRWKFIAFIASAGSATILCAAISIGFSLEAGKKPINSIPGFVGALTGASTIAALMMYRREYPRFDAADEVYKENIQGYEYTKIIDFEPEDDEPQQSTYDPSGWSSNNQSSRALPLYDWDELVDENTGVMIAGGPGYGKTSVACYVLGKLTEHEPAIIEVLDPHGGINEIWEQLGLPVLCEYHEIEQRLAAAITELDARRSRAKNKQPLGSPYIFVCDELDSCFDNFKNPAIISKAIKRLGKEGRKYDISLIFISHSSNAGNKDIDAQERNCYVNIYLGGAAMSYSKYNYKRNDLEPVYLEQQAYPCVVVTGGSAIVAEHPTHSSYSKFKKKGNPPQNILPINQFKVEEEDLLVDVHHSRINLSKDPGGFTPTTPLASTPPITPEVDWKKGVNCKVLQECLYAGVMSGWSKNEATRMLGIDKGSKNPKYKIMSQLYDQFKQEEKAKIDEELDNAKSSDVIDITGWRSSTAKVIK